MAEKMSNLKWLEVLHAVLRDQLQSKEDALVTAFHCMMVNHNCKCVGIGDSWNQDSDVPSDLLPMSWNSDQTVYSLRYTTGSSGVKYLLKIIKANDSMLINMLDVNNDKAAGMSVKVDNHVNDNFKVYVDTYKNLAKVEQEFNDALFGNIQSGKDETKKKSEASTSGRVTPDNTSLLLEERFGASRRFTEPDGRSAFPSVGRGDLDPFGGFYGGGGGMLLDPSGMGMPGRPTLPDFGIGGPGGLPRGAVPPGARFDPFGPPIRGRGPAGGPDPDHLPPPGFSDSFM